MRIRIRMRSSQCDRPSSDPPNHWSCCLRCLAVSSCILEDHVGNYHLRANSAKSAWVSMTTALNATSVQLNALRWSSLGSMETHRVWTPATQGSTRRICTEGRESTNHTTCNRTLMIDFELQTPSASFSKAACVRWLRGGCRVWRIASRPCTARQAESLFALRVKPRLPEVDVFLWAFTHGSDSILRLLKQI